MCIFDNYSHKYKTRRILDLDRIMLNAQRHFQGSLFGCFEYLPYIALTIVCTINVSIDCSWLDVSSPFTRKIILK